MDAFARPNLRRLDFRSRSGHDRPANPFEGARRARTGRLLRVGLHSALATGASAAQVSLIEGLRTPLAHRAIEIVPVAGRVPRWMRCGRRFRIVEVADDYHEVVLRYREPDGRRVKQISSVSNGAWPWLAGTLGFGEDFSVFLELEALVALGADLIITVDDRLLAARDGRHLRGFNLMTPAEAMVIVGVWSRTIHEAFITHTGWNVGMYYWAAARAVTPAAWPSFCAFVRGVHALPDGQEIADLGGSILDHLKMLFRGLDRILAIWQCPTNNDTNDEMQHEFVQIVIAAWSLHDNIALLAGRYLEIDLAGRHGPDWELAKARWTASMARRGATDRRASALVDLVEDHRLYVEAIRDLRNAFAHRARNRMTRMLGTEDLETGRLVFRGTMLDDVYGRLAKTPEGADAWGFGPVQDLGNVGSTDVSTGERHEVQMGRQSSLDLVPFAARLVAYVSWLSNETFRILDPLSDDRIPHRERCAKHRHDTWSTPDGAASVIATSGVAGLVDWALST
jgi:hypothetical protein